MKLLFVTPFLPSPPRFGGQRRLDGLMRNLAARHELSVMAFHTDDAHGAITLEATRAYCRQVVTFPDMELRDVRAKRLLQARSLLSRYSFEHLLLARRREFQARLTALVAAGDFDIVQVEFAQMAAFELPLGRDRKARYVLDEHNIEFDLIRRISASQGSLARRVYSSIDWRKLAREEQHAWRRFDGVSVTSERDGALLRAREPETPLAVIPNGVDIDQFRLSPAESEPDSLLFFGAMNYFPNHDGVAHFVAEILPRILAKRPFVKLRLVGPAPPSIQRLASAHVEVTDFVPEIQPYIDRASVVIVPLRLGGGTRLKIVEAMSKGKAIVSTSLGAEGLDVVHEQTALLADDAQSFADAVVRVLTDAELAARLGAAARRLAEDRYGWPQLVSKLEGFYESLLQAPARPRK